MIKRLLPITVLFLSNAISYCTDLYIVESPTGYLSGNGVFSIDARFSGDDHADLIMGASISALGCAGRAEINDDDVSLSADARLLLLGEGGLHPSLVVGIVDFNKPYAALGKRFNLPYAGVFSIHLGFSKDGVFGGLTKRTPVNLINGGIRLAMEWRSDAISVSSRLESRSGAIIGVQFSRDTTTDRNRFGVEIGFSSRGLIERVHGAESVANQAARLAAKALNRSDR